jgi:SpoIID/LytB domain protein
MVQASRRGFLAQLGAASIAASGAGLVARLAHGQDLSSQERLDLIYSRLFHFDGDGQPVVSIGLCEGQDEVTISANGGVDVLISGDAGTRFRGGKAWKIRRLRGESTSSRFTVVLALVAFDDLVEKARQINAWRQLGFEPKVMECGALFGFRGWMLDNRKFALTHGDFATANDAESAGTELASRFGALGTVLPQRGQPAHGQLLATDEELGTQIEAHDVLWFAPRHGGDLTLRSDGLSRNKGVLTRTYRGQLYTAIDRQGKISVVNRVRELDLLAGVVPAEMPASSPAAALAAQSIAARGQMLAKIGTRHLDAPYVLCAHEHCQVYAGLEREDPRSSAQVHLTRGQVLMRPKSQHLVDTVYSANSGGHGENNEEVWPGAPDPQLRGRPDPMLATLLGQGITSANLDSFLDHRLAAHCRGKANAQDDSYRWSKEVILGQQSAFAPIAKKVGRIERFEVVHRGISGRINHLRIVGTRTHQDVHGELVIRQLLGGLRSSLFSIRDFDPQRGKLTVSGAGYGHGVGMCQTGAMGMAEDGKTFQTILAHYYEGSVLERLW